MDFNTHHLIQENETRRSLLLKTILIAGTIITAIIFIGFLVSQPINQETMINLLAHPAIFVAIIASARLMQINKLDLAIHILIASLIIILFANNLPFGTTDPSLLALIIPLCISSLLLPARWTYVYTALVIICYAILTLYSKSGGDMVVNIFDIITGGGIFLIIARLLATNTAHVETINQKAIEQNISLEQSQATLEQRVTERTASLQATLAELQTSSDTIRQLNVPLLQIAREVMLLPLLGNLTERRVQQIQHEAVTMVHEKRPKFIIIDFTGVSTISASSVQHFIYLVTSLRLLGIKIVLAGIHAELARQLSEFNLSAAYFVVKRDVQQALEYALKNVS